MLHYKKKIYKYIYIFSTGHNLKNWILRHRHGLNWPHSQSDKQSVRSMKSLEA